MYVCMMCFPAESRDGATTITRKASESYRSLSASERAALRDKSAAQRQPMKRSEMKKRAEKIGKKIQQLVCMHNQAWLGFPALLLAEGSGFPSSSYTDTTSPISRL